MSARAYSGLDEAFLAARVWPRVDRSGGAGACWPWLGAANSQGYGLVRVGGRRGRLLYVHRVVAVVRLGPPEHWSRVAGHRCLTRACCNPAHLWWATPAGRAWATVFAGRSRTAMGLAHPEARVSFAEVEAARRERAAGASWTELARRYGVSDTTVRRWVEGAARRAA